MNYIALFLLDGQVHRSVNYDHPGDPRTKVNQVCKSNQHNGDLDGDVTPYSRYFVVSETEYWSYWNAVVYNPLPVPIKEEGL